MRSFAVVAVVLAIITECFGAQSDRSRQRSGPIRSVPVAADIKRDVDFDCPEEFGYYPHPTDCTQYYVCVFGGALLESCTGGLMYSHELQTCDWPRNVGCDGVSALGGEELERISEREPPPPPPSPRRTPPPPPPRAQPNPVVTSRGQPKFNREEYEKQQQLYAEVDDLPPVEEIESDRQQRVYRGQPSTIGQVQKDRDGYTQVNAGRTINNNVIPASIPQNSGKIGSFSFGTQVDDRRAATITQAPQTYSEDKSNHVTDSLFDRQPDNETNEIVLSDVIEKPLLRKKRDLSDEVVGVGETNSTGTKSFSERSSNDEEMEYVEFDTEVIPTYGDERGVDENERGKRQIRYYLKNGYKSVKDWGVPKAIKYVDLRHLNYDPNVQSTRTKQNYNDFINNLRDVTQKPYLADGNSVSSANPFHLYQNENFQSQKPFKPSLPDLSNQKQLHNPANVATQIITKSPPISSLKNNENPFSSLAGGFYNNAPINNQFISQQTPFTKRPNQAIVFPDASQLPSTVITGKPIFLSTSPRTRGKYRIKPEEEQHNNHGGNINHREPIKQKDADRKPPAKEEEYDDDNESEEDEDESSENDSSEKENNHDDDFKPDFPEPPYEYTHYKYKDIENPFANPNFDFDAFLTRLSGGQYRVTPPPKVSQQHNPGFKTIKAPIESTTSSNLNSGIRSSTLNYKGMSTPRPFSGGPDASITVRPSETSQKFLSIIKQNVLDQWTQRPQQQQHGVQEQHQSQQNVYQIPQQTAGLPLETLKPKLQPPNFKDDRQLPLTYSFNRQIDGTIRPTHNHPLNIKGESPQLFSVTQKPYVIVTGTGSPIILSTPKQQFLVKPEKNLTLQPHLVTTGKPYLLSSVKPHNAYITFKQSTSKPLTTLANEQLSALQHYWGSSSPSPQSYFSIQSSVKPSPVSELPKLENLFSQTFRPSSLPGKNLIRDPITVTTTPNLPKRRPIPKPSPEMNDYYYDDDDEEQYYYEPPVKPKYMPSSEVKPQRPPMAQNYKEYDDDNDSYEDERNQRPVNSGPNHASRKPTKITSNKPESVTKNYNDVSVVTKGSIKDSNKNKNNKIPVPVLQNYVTPAPTVLMRPEVSNYEIIHHAPRNRTAHMRKPQSESGPYTMKPPKYLNQTTLRPYTVRHRLAKPTTVNEPVPNNDDKKLTRGRVRHPNIVAQMKHTTPRDNHNQETRYTKTKHDDQTNSLEPTESVVPVSYSASPRPKMLYNGSQNYSPDQYDPFYAVYDEDGELYKDTDYVQQYNTASLRPAVQQTYRGTPPPARRPVQTYTPRPVSVDDYDDALIQGQISNQNQYQSSIRQSTRGDGNELGYDHNPSSAKTTIYEATSISTTPSTTTSTSTTTQRSTTVPYTEAMTPSRYTSRSSTDENSKQNPEPPPSHNPSDGSNSSFQTTPSPVINFSSLAKPFEKTDNIHRLGETLLSTEKTQTPVHTPEVTNNRNKVSSNIVRTSNENKRVLSLTSGFSIRRNPNNTNNPYTLTVLTRPIDEYNKSRRVNIAENTSKNNNKQTQSSRYYSENNNFKEPLEIKTSSDKIEKTNNEKLSSETITERKDFSPELENDEDEPTYVRSNIRRISFKPRIVDRTESTATTIAPTKYYIKSRRPSPFSSSAGRNLGSTENLINTDELIDTGLNNTQVNIFPTSSTLNISTSENRDWQQQDRSAESWDEPIVSPYKSLDNLRKTYSNKDNFVRESTTSSTSTTIFTSSPRNFRIERPRSKPSYYTYKVVDEIVPDQTTEVFSGKVKNVLKAFFNNFVSTPSPKLLDEFSITTPSTTSQPEERVVNIGFQKKMLKHADEKPLRNVQRIQVITEPTVHKFIHSDNDLPTITESDFKSDFSPSSTSPSFSSTTPPIATEPPVMLESSTNNDYHNKPLRQSFETQSYPESAKSQKFQKLLDESAQRNQNYDRNTLNEALTTKKTNPETSTIPSETNWNRPTNKLVSEIASTTSTTKSTSTAKLEPTSTTKSLSFPTRATRVNPAIKLAATNPGGGRRSYQTSTKCSSDNSLQANPKCNEIKYQRPSSTRGRGSAHYSTASEAPQPIPNRGTPPTRSRPTLKPSTAIVSKSTEFVDIYSHPPSRPAPVYPQPTPDKTAAKCRKDVCLLPDCYCGGKDIPGDLPVETVPQIVLLTFDDSVNDLNKGLYTDLFEKGRVNPNGCAITATFYVSHEWTDYSQVQNLYAAGHEMASHTVSHSFGEQFSQKKWNREVGGQREILAAYGGVKLEDVRGMRAPFLSVGGNKMFKMLYDSNFTYDSSLPVYENRPPSWPYTLDYKLFHDCMIPPCPTKSYPGVWEVPMVMWQDLNGGRCSMGDACANPPDAEGVYKMILKNFDRHYTTNRAPFGLFYHAAWFTQPHHKEGFIMFLDFINQMQDVWIVTNWQALQWVRDPTPISRLNNFQPFQCNYQDRPKKCNNPKVCNLWHKSGVRYMRTCQPCPELYPWTGKTGIKSSRIDNDIGE